MTYETGATITRRKRTVSPGITLDVFEAGRPGDPVVVLLHGFPESADAWRHQLGPIADAGYHVLAPDQRGYGESSSPEGVAAYGMEHLTDDVCGLLDAVGAEQAVVVGHDFGGLVAWAMGLLHPGRCRGLHVAAAPLPRWPALPTTVLRERHGDRFFYILYFQEPDTPEAELDADPARFLRSMIWLVAGESGGQPLSSTLPLAGTRLIESLETALGRSPDDLPPWLAPEDFETLVGKFRASGFAGPVNWYRNFDHNYAVTGEIPPSVLSMPTAFVVGDRDPVYGRPGLLEQITADLPTCEVSVLPGIGHWIQQEAPEEFTRSVLTFLDRVGRA